MYCRHCGTENDDNAYRCIECDEVLQGGGPTSYESEHVPSHLAPAILVTIFCCLPFGIVAIIYASQVSSQLRQGQIEMARRSSEKAKMWSWIGFGAVLIPIVLGILAAIAIPKFASTRDRAYEAMMKSDLKNLVVAEEHYWVDHGSYADLSQIRSADLWSPSTGVDVEFTGVNADGWAATATYSEYTGECGVFIGAAKPPHPSLVIEAEVQCW